MMNTKKRLKYSTGKQGEYSKGEYSTGKNLQDQNDIDN